MNEEAATSHGGLPGAEAAARLASEGFNELPRSTSRTPLRIAAEVMREPMLALLLAGGLIYVALGDLQEALILLVFALASIVITVVQETRTERVLDALRDLTSPRALVIRDGVRVRIAGREVVRGDLVVLSEGDRVPADAIVRQCQDLQVDESLLTGESLPVGKVATDSPAPDAQPRPGGDGLAQVFSGSLIVRGSGIAEVTATGPRSEIGKIGQSLGSLETEPPRLNAQMRRLVRIFALFGGAVTLLAVVLYGMFRGAWLDALLAGIALGMSMLPEELPVVLTVFMAMGAWRISRARVLTRRASAIEALGSATVLCTDKTGTLTENRMTLSRLLPKDCAAALDVSGSHVPDASHDLIRAGVLASAPEPFDPMERAFHDLGRRVFGADIAAGQGLSLLRTYGLRRDLLAVTQVWRDGSALLVAAKGAPEAIAGLCGASADEREALKAAVDGMAVDGLRVLGVAQARIDDGDLPDDPRSFPFAFLGLVGLVDPLRPSVRDAVSDCRSAGIRVVMITGDYPATARAIAGQAGLDAKSIMDGDSLRDLSDDDLAESVRTVSIFARIMPEQKLRIVKALEANGDVVAMTGDGVNDAPSLKAAHIGIAMGGRGTDVAREASAIVLLDDDFGSVVKAIRLGRRIYDNLRKAMGFIFAVHVPIAGLALLPLLFRLPILFSPVHIAFLEMVIDPVCTLVFEAETEEDDIMRRPPRAPDAPLFPARLIGWSVVQGLLAFAFVAAIYVVASRRGLPDDEVRALAFLSLNATLIALIFVNRSFTTSVRSAIFRPNGALLVVLSIVAGVFVLIQSWSVARELFRFGPLHGHDVALAGATGVATLLVLELLKPLWLNWKQRAPECQPKT